MAAHSASQPRRRRVSRRVAALALLCLVALAGAGATLAFTTQQAGADNVLTFKNVKMRILQTELVGQDEVPVQDGAAVRADKGEISRIVRVENMGAADIFVRVRPVMVAKTPEGSTTAGAEVDAHVAYTLNLGDEANQWTYDPQDGWYYYNSPVAADGGTTAELMTALEFNGDYYTLTGKGGSFEMTLDAQAVQSDNQASGATALTAVGWPSTDEAGE